MTDFGGSYITTVPGMSKNHQIIPIGYVTVAEAARMLGITHHAADKRIKRGYLQTEIVFVLTRLVSLKAIEDSVKITPKRGRKGVE